MRGTQYHVCSLNNFVVTSRDTFEINFWTFRNFRHDMARTVSPDPHRHASPRTLSRVLPSLARLFCCCSIHLELSTCWDSTVRKHSHVQTPLENPSILTQSSCAASSASVSSDLKALYKSVIIIIIIIMHKGTSSSYRSIDWFDLAWFSSMSFKRLYVFGLHGVCSHIYRKFFGYILLFLF